MCAASRLARALPGRKKQPQNCSHFIWFLQKGLGKAPWGLWQARHQRVTVMPAGRAPIAAARLVRGISNPRRFASLTWGCSAARGWGCSSVAVGAAWCPCGSLAQRALQARSHKRVGRRGGFHRHPALLWLSVCGMQGNGVGPSAEGLLLCHPRGGEAVGPASRGPAVTSFHILKHHQQKKFLFCC